MGRYPVQVKFNRVVSMDHGNYWSGKCRGEWRKVSVQHFGWQDKNIDSKFYIETICKRKRVFTFNQGGYQFAATVDVYVNMCALHSVEIEDGMFSNVNLNL